MIYGPTRRERTVFAVIGASVAIAAYQSIANFFRSAGGGTARLFMGGIGVGLGLWAIGKIRSGKARDASQMAHDGERAICRLLAPH